MNTRNLIRDVRALMAILLITTFLGCATGRTGRIISPTIPGSNLFAAAEELFEEKEFEQAGDLYEKYLKYEPDSTLADNALFRLGQVAMAKGNYILSLKLFQDLPNRYPGSELIPSARFQAARSLYLNLSWDEALSALENFRRDFPMSQYNPHVMLIISDIYIKTREFAKAKETIIKLLDIYPDDPLKPSALFQFGLIEQYLGETDEAAKYLKMALESDLPDDLREDALYALGTLSLMKGELLSAVEYFSERIQYISLTERRERGVKKVKGLIQERLRDDQIQELIEQHPADFPGDLAMIEMAERQFDQGEILAAREYLEMFLKGFPDHPDASTIEQKLSRFGERPDQIAIGKFGCIAPLTGPLSGYGEKMIRGVKMAIEEYNQAYGTSLKVVLFDSMAKPENAQKGVELLAYEEKVAAIIGPLLTKTAMAAATTAEQIGIPMFTPTATGDGLPESGEFVFRNCLTNKHQAEALAEYAIEDLGLTRFGVMFPYNAYGQEMMALFSDRVDALKANVEIIEFYDNDDTDFKDQLLRIHQIRPEALFLPGSYEKIVLIAPQIPFYEPEEPDPNDPNYVLAGLEASFSEEDPSLTESSELTGDIPLGEEDIQDKEIGEKKKEILLLGTDGWYDSRLIQEGDTYVENAVLSVGFFPESNDARVREFVTSFQRRYGEPPDLVSAQAYDATNMLLEASGGGESSWDTTRQNLALIKDFPGVSGRTTIQPSGDSLKEVSLLKVKRRRFTPLERSLFNLNYSRDLLNY